MRCFRGPLAADPAPQVALWEGIAGLDPLPMVSSGRSAEATGTPMEVVSMRDSPSEPLAPPFFQATRPAGGHLLPSRGVPASPPPPLQPYGLL